METDHADLEAAADIVRVAHPHGHLRVDVEPHVMWVPGRDDPLAFYKGTAPTRDRVMEVKRAGGWYHIPDVAVAHPTYRDLPSQGRGLTMWREPRPIRLIVEVDGGVHNARATKTEERNTDYRLAGIPHIAINKLDCEARGVVWEDELRAALSRGYLP